MPLNITAETPRSAVTFALTDAKDGPSVTVQAPQPYAAGHPLTEGEASQLNQVLKENMSNNLRARIKLGVVSGEGEAQTSVPHTNETAQAVVDKFFEDYEMGVRRGGGGEARVTDPVEREARKLAREAAKDFAKANGLKPADVDLGEIAGKIFEKNREALMKAGKKLVADLERARSAASGIDLSDIQLSGQAEPEQAAA